MLVPVLGGGVGPQVKDFEQVSSDDHQMSVVGGRYRGLMFGEGWRGEKEGRSKGVPYHLNYPMMHLMLPPPPLVYRQIPAKTLPSPLFVCGR